MGKGQTYPCRFDVDGSECGERFTTVAKRCQHIETAHGLIACRYYHCGLGFSSKEQYQEHCLGEKNHASLVCRDCIEEGQFKMFMDNQKLIRHTINNHPVDRARLEAMTAKPDSYWCPVCQKPFDELKQHIVLKLADPDHAALMPDEEKQRQYCSECDKFYRNLCQHRNVVHIKPFVCTEPDCEYACGTIQKLKRHLILRHKLPVPDAYAIINRTRVEWAGLTGRTITSMNGIRQSTRALVIQTPIRPIPPGGTTEPEDVHMTFYYGPGLIYMIIFFSPDGRETRYTGSTQAPTKSGDPWEMAKVRLDQHSRSDSDMAAAIRNENYRLTIVKSWPCIGRFALHALEAAQICTLKSGESSGPRGYLAANVALPTTKETLCQQLADHDHHRWITADPIPDLPERHSPKTSPTMRIDSSFQPSAHHCRTRVSKRKPQPKRQCKR